jgi:aminoglycoside phosphotransferase (APT) family kinase protein
MHPDQLTITTETVHLLVEAQFPAWRGLPVRAVPGAGTVNAIFRLGTDLVARFPLRATSRSALETEAAAGRLLSGRTGFSTPEPVALGEPGFGYPQPWSVQTWLPGTVATSDNPVSFAEDLAAFITGVRGLGTGGRRFAGGGRGGVLSTHDDWIETCLRQSSGLLDVARLRRLWAAYRELPRGDEPDLMNHSDLIPGNLLTSTGRLTGVLDVGGLRPADPALDLVGAWHLFDTGPRRVLRDALGSPDAQWARGQAWAFEQAMGAIWYYIRSNPPMSLMSRRTLDRIVADPAV